MNSAENGSNNSTLNYLLCEREFYGLISISRIMRKILNSSLEIVNSLLDIPQDANNVIFLCRIEESTDLAEKILHITTLIDKFSGKYSQ